MNLTEEQLNEITEMAYRLITPGLIAINIGVDENDFIQVVRTPGSKARNAFYQGYLKQQVELRDAIIKAAKNGSNPAQVELIKYIKQMQQYVDYE